MCQQDWFESKRNKWYFWVTCQHLKERAALSVSLPLPSPALCVSPSLTAFFPGWGVHGPSGSAAFVSDLECSENFVNSSCCSGEGEEGEAVDGTQPGSSSRLLWRRHQALWAGDNPPGVMTRQRLCLLTTLALLGLLVGFANLSRGSAGEDEDYYMQELLTREQYNHVQMLEKPVASKPDGHEQSRQNPAKKMPQGKAGKKTDKTTADAKSGKTLPFHKGVTWENVNIRANLCSKGWSRTPPEYLGKRCLRG